MTPIRKRDRSRDPFCAFILFGLSIVSSVATAMPTLNAILDGSLAQYNDALRY